MENFDKTMEIPVLNNKLLKNIELENLIKYKLGKSEIQREDLAQIKDLILDGRKIDDSINIVYFEELDLFPNLEEIEIKNLSISEENMEKIKDIKKIKFENCRIESIKKLNTQYVLSFINSQVNDIIDLNNANCLQELELDNISINSFDFLKKFINLKKLKIKNIKGFSLEKINFELPIEYLSLKNLEKINTDVILNFKNLDTISVDLYDSEKFDSEINILKDNNIKVIYNEIYNDEGGNYDYGI